MPSFTSELRQRRVLPLLGAYLGGMWLLTELAGFAVERFGIAGAWADGLFLAMWLLLPAALLVIWRVGPPGDAAWGRHDRSAIGLNLALAAGVLALVFGRAAPAPEATPDAAPFADASAEAPRPARVAVFTRPGAGGSRQDAMALLALTLADLDHDGRFATPSLLSSAPVVARLRRSGREDLLAAPLGDLRLAAQDARADGYVVASLAAGPDGPRLEAEFHALDPDRALPSLAVPAASTWAGADALAAGIRERFGRPARAGEGNDPDVRTVTTDSKEALAAYAAGLEALALEQDAARAAEGLQQAWNLDPDFILAGYASMAALLQQGRNPEALQVLQRLLPRMERLPERQRFALQIRAAGDPARQRTIYAAWQRRFPADREPRRALAWLDLYERPEDAEALATLRELVLADGDATGYGQVAGVYGRLGQYEPAAALLREALEKFPDDAGLTAALADVLTRSGQAEPARQLLEEWAQLSPGRVAPWLALSNLHYNQGRAAEAWDALAQAEAQASHADARQATLQHRIRLLEIEGRSAEAVARLPELLALQRESLQGAPLAYAHHLPHVLAYARARGPDAALDWLRDAFPTGTDAALVDYSLGIGRLLLASDREDAQALAESLPALRRLADGFQASGLRTDTLALDRFEAEQRRLAGQPAEALERFRALETARRAARARGQSGHLDGASFYVPAIEAAVAARDLPQARQWLQALERTEAGDPHTRLARARVLAAAGDTAGARESLAQALAAWAAADPGFPPREQALRLAATLGPG